jgi:acetyl-CoA carboxylase carboxyltransferase component
VESGVAVAFSRRLREVAEEQGQPAADALRLELEEKYAAALSPFPAAHGFGVHDLIDPKETRPMLCEWLDLQRPLLKARLNDTTRQRSVYRP